MAPSTDPCTDPYATVQAEASFRPGVRNLFSREPKKVTYFEMYVRESHTFYLL